MKAIIIAVIVALGAAGCSTKVIETLDSNPAYLGTTPYGFAFQMPDNTQRICMTLGENSVYCKTSNDEHKICEYRHAPRYFDNCYNVTQEEIEEIILRAQGAQDA